MLATTPQTALVPSGLSVVPEPASRGGRGRRQLPAAFGGAMIELVDLVRSTGAFDGALAVRDGGDLRVVTALRSRIPVRTICGSAFPAVASAIAGREVAWLEPSAPEGLYLPPHSQVLYVPFRTGGLQGAALLAYDHRITLSASDRGFLARAFGEPEPQRFAPAQLSTAA